MRLAMIKSQDFQMFITFSSYSLPIEKMGVLQHSSLCTEVNIITHALAIVIESR